MTAFVQPLDAVRRSDAASVGGKAAVLGTLKAEGFPVPPGLCLTTDAFVLALAPYRDQIAHAIQDRDLRDPAQANDAADAIDALLGSLAVPEPVVEALRVGLPNVASDDAPVAVRSSATDEDGSEVSFAGQYETVPGVRGEAAIIAAVSTCWRSRFSANALAARAMAGRGVDDGTDGAMALLIQPLIDAECAGVCFTQDPVRPERDAIVVEAAWGLGAGTVDGSVATDTAWLIRDQPRRIEDRRIVEKTERIGLDPLGGQRREAVAEDRQRAACLPEPWLQRIAEFGIAAELLLGRPQDVEWAIAGGQVWILQSRPITTLPAKYARTWDFPVTWEHDADRQTVWWLHDEDRDAPPTPLEIDVSAVFAQTQGDAIVLSGWGGSLLERVINGRRYVSWVPSQSPAGQRRVCQQAQRDLAIRLRAEEKTIWDHWAPEIRTAIARLHAFDAADDGAKLADHLEDAMGAFQRHWTIHWCSWADEGDAHPARRAFAAMTGLEGRDAEQAFAKLIDGEETILTRMIDGLDALAHSAAAVPELAALVTERPSGVWSQIEQMREAAGFREQMAAFLEQFGDHMGMGYGSSSTLKRPTWRQDPAQVLAMTAPYMQPGAESPTSARSRARAEREARVERFCAACDDSAKVAEFRRWLPVARWEARALEEHNYWIDQVAYGQLRTAIDTAGRWLVNQGSVTEVNDIFWLHMTEIGEALRSPTPESQVALISERKAEAEARQGQTPPPLLGTPRAQLDPRPPLKDEVTPGNPEGGTIVSGTGASAGRHRGRARVVPVTTAVPLVEPGDVLVAVNAGPAWTPIFPTLGGLVLDEGAFTQHAATSAREYGVPAVIHARGATRRIPDGAWVVVDGEAGTVEIERPDRN